jgi:hypothetical protein
MANQNPTAKRDFLSLGSFKAIFSFSKYSGKCIVPPQHLVTTSNEHNHGLHAAVQELISPVRMVCLFLPSTSHHN